MQSLKKIFLISLLFLFFACKNSNGIENKRENLLGVWESTLYLQEGGHFSSYPFRPSDGTEWYNYLAFSKDGKVYKAYKTINTIDGKSVLVTEEIFDVVFCGNVMNWQNKAGVREVSFILKKDELTTVQKDQFNKQLIYLYKKVESPSLDEIINAKL